MAKQFVKVVGKHAKGCAGVKYTRLGSWSSPWGPIAQGKHGPPIETTWKTYGPNKDRNLETWVRFRCNDVDCKAELHVEAEFILNAVKNRTSTGAKK